jgi:2,4-dienoyl-CoA reductase-like NADH-dependent reductase (Old Yellow Enzyme family)
VAVSVFPDTTLSRGAVPDSFWSNPGIAARLRRAAPSRRRRAVIKAGAWWGGHRAPFTPVWNRPLFRAVKRRATIPVFAVGGIRTGAEVRAIVESGDADVVGIGRPFYAEPDLAARVLDGADVPGRCRSSNRCVAAQMLGMRGVCYNPEVTKRPTA